ASRNPLFGKFKTPPPAPPRFGEGSKRVQTPSQQGPQPRAVFVPLPASGRGSGGGVVSPSPPLRHQENEVQPRAGPARVEGRPVETLGDAAVVLAVRPDAPQDALAGRQLPLGGGLGPGGERRPVQPLPLR